MKRSLYTKHNTLFQGRDKPNAENSGGLHLNQGYPQAVLHRALLRACKLHGIRRLPASDAHKPADTGVNIHDLPIYA